MFISLLLFVNNIEEIINFNSRIDDQKCSSRVSWLKERSWPVSRVLSNTFRHSGSHSSGPAVTCRLKQPTRGQREPRYCPPIWSCSGWGLPCRFCYQKRGGLLPHRFTIAVLIAEPWAVCSLWHFPSPRGVRSLTGILLCGARTFLYASELHSDCPASFTAYSTRWIVCFRAFEGPVAPNRMAKTILSHHEVRNIQSCSGQNSTVPIANDNKKIERLIAPL